MRILSVSLKNFKSHADAFFPFEPGINAIYGENGAGKTSVLEAIAWVLFDYNPYSKTEMIRSGANSCEVAVTFISALDERTYEVRRSTTTGYRIFDPQLNHRFEYEVKADILQWLRQHLGILPGTDLPRLFTTMVGVPQGTFTADFLKTPRDRKDMFDRILHVEDYQKVYKDLLGLQKHSDEQVTQVKHQIELLNQQLQDWDPLQEQLTTLTQDLEKCCHALQVQVKSLKEYGEQLAQMDQIAQHRTQMDQAIQSLVQQIATQAKQDEQMAQSLQDAQQAQAKVQATEAGFQIFQQAEQRIRELEQHLGDRRKCLQQRESVLESMGAHQTEMTRLQERLAILAQSAQHIEALRHEVVLQDQLEQQQRHLTELSERLSQLHQHHQLLRTQWDAQRRYCQQCSQRVESAQQAQQRCQATKPGHDAYLQAEQHLVHLNQALKQRQSRIQEGNEIRSVLHNLQVQQATLTQQRERLLQLDHQLQALQPQIVEQVALETKQSELQAKLNQFGATRVQLDQQQQERQTLAQRLQELSNRIEQRHKMRKQVEQIPELEQQVDRISSQLNRVTAARQFREELQQVVSDSQQGLTDQTHRIQHVLRVLDAIQKDCPELKDPLQAIPPILTQGTALTHQILNQVEGILQDISQQVSVPKLKSQQQALKKTLQQYYSYKGLVDELPTLEAEQVDLGEQITKLDESIEDLSWNLEAEPTFNRQMAELQAQVHRLEDPKAQAHLCQQELKQKPDLEAQWETLQAQIHHQESLLGSVEQALAATQHLEADIEQCYLQRQEVQNAYQHYLQAESEANTLPERQTEWQQAQDQLTTIEKQGKQAHQAIQELEHESGSCSDLAAAQTEVEQQLQQLGDPRSQVKRLHQELKAKPDLDQQLHTIQIQVQHTQASLATLDQQLAETAHLETDLVAQQALREEHRLAYETFLKANQLAATLPQLQACYQESQQVLAALKTQLQDHRTQFENISRTYNAEQHDQLRATHKEAELMQARLQTQIQGIEPQRERIQAQLDRLKGVREQLQHTEKRLKEREKLHRFIKFSRTTYRDAGPRITRLYLDAVNTVADQLFREILNRPMMSLSWEADYDISIQEGGNEKRRFLSLSGGEQMAAALAVRLALLKVVGDLEIAFFDEPTTNMDQIRRQRLAESITNLKSFEQLFVISHDDSFQSFADNAIHMTREDPGYGA